MEKLTIEEIKEAIRDNLRRAKATKSLTNEEAFSISGHSFKKPSGIKKSIQGMLWKYGLRYANVIRKIPGLKRIAEYSYWILAVKKTTSDSWESLSCRSGVHKDGIEKWENFYSEDAGESFLRSNAQHHEYFVRLIEKYAERKTGEVPRLIEIGIGTGTLSIFFSRRPYNVTGIDKAPFIVSKAVERNRRLKGSAKFSCMDALDIARHFEENAFDVAFSQGLLEHFDDAGIQNLINAQLKVARNVVFSVPSIHWPNTDFGDERKMTLEQWKTLLGNFGFRPDHISYYQQGDLHIAVVIRREEHP